MVRYLVDCENTGFRFLQRIDELKNDRQNNQLVLYATADPEIKLSTYQKITNSGFKLVAKIDESQEASANLLDLRILKDLGRQIASTSLVDDDQFVLMSGDKGFHTVKNQVESLGYSISFIDRNFNDVSDGVFVTNCPHTIYQHYKNVNNDVVKHIYKSCDNKAEAIQILDVLDRFSTKTGVEQALNEKFGVEKFDDIVSDIDFDTVHDVRPMDNFRRTGPTFLNDELLTRLAQHMNESQLKKVADAQSFNALGSKLGLYDKSLMSLVVRPYIDEFMKRHEDKVKPELIEYLLGSQRMSLDQIEAFVSQEGLSPKYLRASHPEFGYEYKLFTFLKRYRKKILEKMNKTGRLKLKQRNHIIHTIRTANKISNNNDVIKQAMHEISEVMLDVFFIC